MIKGFISKNYDGSVEKYVTIHGSILEPKESQEVINHSPNGFSWGYGGSGPAQLALAILLRFCRKEEAVKLHQPFKWDIIAKFPIDEEWELTDTRVHDWLDAMRKRGRHG